MCTVNIESNKKQDANFIVYNAILSIDSEEFTIDDVVDRINKRVDLSKEEIIKLMKAWTKAGIIEDQVNSYALCSF
ncbi:MAG: hypothetical protein JXA68_11985 [Ignavibacteriales bacterium]|nr:hypothetical protein [Ignavibacteriales bacterium]